MYWFASLDSFYVPPVTLVHQPDEAERFYINFINILVTRVEYLTIVRCGTAKMF